MREIHRSGLALLVALLQGCAGQNDGQAADAGLPCPDAGELPDAGQLPDAGEPSPDGGSPSDAGDDPVVRAFPGAEGFGSTTTGGRGGTVLFVTNLNDSGPGSLRAALTTSGPRIVVFRTGGVIELASTIYVDEPYLTVAGQTAPGGGVLIRGPYAPDSHDGGPTCIEIATHDIVLRGLRIRAVNRAAIGLYAYPYGSIYNIVIDHCSLSWSTDTVLDVWYDPYDITVSWNIVSEAMGGQNGKGMLIGGFDACETPGQRFSVHHNLFAHNALRNPQIKQKTGSPEVINNVIYNWYWHGTRTFSTAAIIGNYYISGPNTANPRPVSAANEGECPSLEPATVYVSHNIAPSRPSDTGDDWDVVEGGSSTYRTDSPPFPLSGVTVDDVSSVKEKVLAGAGATVPARDAVDVRVIGDVNAATGGYIADPIDVGGWPSLDPGTPPTDTDQDGIPDSWESAHGLNPNDAADASSLAPSGYSWIEEYINSFFLGP